MINELFNGDLSGKGKGIANSYIIIKRVLFKTSGIENAAFDVYDCEWNAEITDEEKYRVLISYY